MGLKHYHRAMAVLTTATDFGAVVLWFAAIMEFAASGRVTYSMPVIMMYFGAIIVVFALLTYQIEKYENRNSH